jgi:hypothetical protein
LADSSKLFAFIDESGDPNLQIEKEGVSQFYICVAVIVDGTTIIESTNFARKISEDYFSGSPIKSNKIRRKHERRLMILNEIAKINFGYYAIVINKQRLNRDSGLQYKRSFLKHLNSYLYSWLDRIGNNLSIVADSMGGKEFIESFRKYMKKRTQPILRSSVKLVLRDDDKVPLLQVADFIAGTLGYCFEPDKKSEFSNDFRRILRIKEIGSYVWPPVFHLYEEVKKPDQQEINTLIKELSLKKASRILQELEEETDKDSALQATVLSRLLFVELDSSIDETRVFTNRHLLNEHLMNSGFLALTSSHAFSSTVAIPLRKRGVLLAGTTRGYKIATSSEDLIADIRDKSRKIIPMLKRISSVRQTVRAMTSNELDILVEHGNTVLIDIIEQYTKSVEKLRLDDRPKKSIKEETERLL